MKLTRRLSLQITTVFFALYFCAGCDQRDLKYVNPTKHFQENLSGGHDDSREYHLALDDFRSMSSKYSLSFGIFFKLEDPSHALNVCNRLIEYEPDFAKAFLYRAKLYWLTGEIALAFQDVNKSLEIARNSEALVTRAKIKLGVTGKPQ